MYRQVETVIHPSMKSTLHQCQINAIVTIRTRRLNTHRILAFHKVFVAFEYQLHLTVTDRTHLQPVIADVKNFIPAVLKVAFIFIMWHTWQ